MMANNLTGGIVSVFFEKYSQREKIVNAFEINFYYSLTSIVVCGAILLTDGQIPQYVALMEDPGFVSLGVQQAIWGIIYSSLVFFVVHQALP